MVQGPGASPGKLRVMTSASEEAAEAEEMGPPKGVTDTETLTCFPLIGSLRIDSV